MIHCRLSISAHKTRSEMNTNFMNIDFNTRSHPAAPPVTVGLSTGEVWFPGNRVPCRKRRTVYETLLDGLRASHRSAIRPRSRLWTVDGQTGSLIP